MRYRWLALVVCACASAGSSGGATLNTSQVTMLASSTAAPADTSSGAQINVPLDADIPPGGKLVVAISAPNTLQTGHFYIGSTAGGETHPAYQSSTACSITT